MERPNYLCHIYLEVSRVNHLFVSFVHLLQLINGYKLHSERSHFSYIKNTLSKSNHTINIGWFYLSTARKKSVDLNKINLPTDDEIRIELECCSALAIRMAVELGLVKAKNTIYHCKVNPYSEKLMSKKKRKKEAAISSSHISLSPKFLQNIKLKNYYGKTLAKKITETSPYVEIKCHDSSLIIVRKTSLCWLLVSEQQKLSSDRLRRVQHPIKWENALNQQNHVLRSKPLYNYKSFFKHFLYRHWYFLIKNVLLVCDLRIKKCK